jgi:hypothetical protein
MSAREVKLADNEDFFRRINEHLEQQTPDTASSLIVICECDDVDCAQRIPSSRADYEAVRAEPTHFLVAPGHSDPEVEEVVRRADTFEVVRKRGVAGEEAADLDTSDNGD